MQQEVFPSKQMLNYIMSGKMSGGIQTCLGAYLGSWRTALVAVTCILSVLQRVHLEDNITNIKQIAVSHQNCQERVQQPSKEEILWWEQELATVMEK